VEKVAKHLGYFYDFQKSTQSEQSLSGPKFAQSGQPAPDMRQKATSDCLLSSLCRACIPSIPRRQQKKFHMLLG
jgi:hypothetical protein